MPMCASGMGVIFVFGVGSILGQFLGGWAGQCLVNIRPSLQCVLMGVSVYLGMLPLFYIINGPVTTAFIPLFYLMGFICGVVVSINGPNVRSVLQVCACIYMYLFVCII